MGFASYREDMLSRQVSAAGRLKQSTGQENSTATGKEPQGANQQNQAHASMRDFTVASARPLPVIIVADVSGSMAADGKITILNTAVAEMISAFAEEDAAMAEIHVCVVTFGGDGARVHKPLQPASGLVWEPMSAAGPTPMGAAFSLVQSLIEDHDAIPSRAYRPAVVLVSDGAPTDDWQTPLNALLASERTAKVARFAMAIGVDADRSTLAKFLAGDNNRIYEA